MKFDRNCVLKKTNVYSVVQVQRSFSLALSIQTRLSKSQTCKSFVTIIMSIYGQFFLIFSMTREFVL